EAFPGPTQAARIARILGGEPDVEGFEGPLQEVVLACLDKDPARRPDASALLQQLVTLPADGGRAGATTAVQPSGGWASTTVQPSEGEDRTEVAPSPDAATGVGVDRTRMETSAPEQVPGTRVAPPAKVDPTRAYTRMAGADEQAVHQAPPSPPHHPGTYGQGQASGYGQGQPSGGYGTPSGSGSWIHRGGVPPYHFLGVRHEDPGTLAAAMQENWTEAVRVFSDTGERDALGAWLTDDIGDTRVDRALFRRKVTDANLALATFVAQTRPDLPPVFRGRTVTIDHLTELFSDPAPVLTGAPQANEMALLARPVVLRTMGLHHSDRPGEHQHLADRLDEAERAGIAFQKELSGALNGWSDVRAGVNPALVLAFLLGPDTPPRPESKDPGVREWIDILWTKVAAAAQPAAAGYAAAVHGAVPTLVTLAQQRREWEGRYATVSAEHEALSNAVRRQRYLELAKRLSTIGVLAFLVNFVASGIGNEFLTMVSGLVFFAGLIGVVVSGPALRLIYGAPARRAHRRIELQNRTDHLLQLRGGVERIRSDLQTARRLTSG
ncbi:serine/threonine protein kinase, partial [Nocardiopsis sp. HNM0947]